MFRIHSPRLFGSLFAAGLLFAPGALAGDDQDDFHRAYYLEKEQGDLEAALALYRQVAHDDGAPQDLRQRARLAARACAEEIAASDFANLMPASTLLYVELNNPGDQLSTLLGLLGLLQGSQGSGNIAISPRLVSALLGVRGAAVGITEVDTRGGPPNAKGWSGGCRWRYEQGLLGESGGEPPRSARSGQVRTLSGAGGATRPHPKGGWTHTTAGDPDL